MVAAVRDDPARRLGLASRFYDDRPGCVSIRSYRRAEMAFMRWQIRRGLLAAPDAPGRGANGGARSTRACCGTRSGGLSA